MKSSKFSFLRPLSCHQWAVFVLAGVVTSKASLFACADARTRFRSSTISARLSVSLVLLDESTQVKTSTMRKEVDCGSHLT